MNRFQKIYRQGKIDVVEVWVDTETGVNYVFHKNGNAGGFTSLLDQEGKPVITRGQLNIRLRIGPGFDSSQYIHSPGQLA